MNKYNYKWTDEIWSIHLELRNTTPDSGVVEIHYDNTGHQEDFPYFASENMRYNICRYSTENTGITIYLPKEVEVLVFENLDRAFYTADPVLLQPF